MDVIHIPCGQDGLDHITTLIDCYDREIMQPRVPISNHYRKTLVMSCLLDGEAYALTVTT